MPEEFKMTEIGLVPENWELKRISEVCQVKGSTISLSELIEQDTKNNKDAVVHGIKVSDMNLVGNEWEISRANIEARLPAQRVIRLSIPAKSVIFPKRGAAIATNKKRLTSTWTALDPNLIAVIPTKVLDCYYLLYWFNSIDISKFQSPGPTPQLNRKDVDPVLMPLPPLPEQKAIAGVLSTIQKAIETQDKIIAAAKELKKSLMRHLFTYGPVPVAEAENVPLKDTEIGSVPEHWEMVRLEDITDKPEYGFTETASSEIIGPKFLRITDIQNGAVNWVSVPYCKCSPVEEGKYRLRSGDILFARIGATTGKTYLIKDCPTAVFASYLIRVRCKSSLIPDYLSQFTTTQYYWDQINASKGGRLKQGVNIPVLKSLLVPFPSLSEQVEIAHTLSAIDRKIEVEENRKAALQDLFKTMLHKLMTGKVRVKDLEVTAA